MKKSLILILAISLFACQNSKKVNIKGTITNSDLENVVLSNLSETYKDSFPLNEDGTFEVTLKLEREGMYYFNAGGGIYLTPGADLTVSLDVKIFDEDGDDYLDVSGKGSDASNLAFDIIDNNYKFHHQDREKYIELITCTPDSFILKTEEFYNINYALVDSVASNGEMVTEKLKNKLKLFLSAKRAEDYFNYSRAHKHYAKNDTSTVPEYFSHLVDSVSLTDKEAYNDFRQYRFYVNNRYYTIFSEEIGKAEMPLDIDFFVNKYMEAFSGLEPEQKAKDEMEKRLFSVACGTYWNDIYKELRENKIPFDTKVFLNTFIDKINAQEVEQKVKDEVGKRLLSIYTYIPDSVSSVLEERCTEFVKNEEYLNEFKNSVKKFEKVKQGLPAPEFSYPDINGNVVSSNDLKGKIIYIDVWATWCGPCKGEIPHLKKLEEELHNKDIAFVSISVDQDKAAWEKMVKEMNLAGYQLHTPDGREAQIMQDYVIRGIPRFILIDKEGKIINANASRPSDPETKKTLLKLLANS